MQTRIREVRKAKGLTLAEVAARCVPATTAQTIGRLETGMRTVSVGWLNRIAAALGVDPSELVSLPDRPDVPVVAILSAHGAEAPRRPMVLAPPLVRPDLIGMTVDVAQGEYRAGDELWLNQMESDEFATALNKDVLVPVPVGRYIFGRLVAVADGRLTIMPLTVGAQLMTLPFPEWLGAVALLVRKL